MFEHCFVNPPVLEQTTNAEGFRQYVNENGDAFESVTTYLARMMDKDFLTKWRKRIGNASADSISKAASLRGSRLHKAIEMYLLNDDGLKPLLAAEILTKSLFIQVKPFLNRLNRIRLIEKPLFSPSLRLAGTPDCMADYDGIFSTVDFKTSTNDKKEEWISSYRLQTAIYSRMFHELFGILPEQSVIIMSVDKNPMPFIYVEPSEKGQARLDQFLADPILFQKNKL